MTATNEVVAHVGMRLIELTSRQHESLFHALITLVDMLERLEGHVERVEQRLSAIESHITTTGAKP
ncbi:hypothetical protein HW932_00240 [Allochromatium humboldtianum]|uniref:Uncharacterized protein n=1 Tax=Allochromatium humboldtianum TaxID=504901 RepID=A0A850R5K1_9GAMM|nr:hypothetical protein [Allochromatium humboldtianum]NVZ07686.1 hypothetical protein [Allochromatium humboldtianum]